MSISSLFFIPQFETIWGDIEEVNQVSKTSCSPIKPLGLFLWFSVNPGGVSITGSIGKSFIFGKITLSKSIVLFSSKRYQTGIGTPKNLCLLIHQSKDKFSVQFENLFDI